MEEADAWAIAMAWQSQLQGKVRLVVDRDGPVRSIVESYAWVRLDEPHMQCPPGCNQDNESCRQEAASIMRAVMISWSALAACPGFGGSENGGFWKRVISELQQPQSSSSSIPKGRWRAFDRPEAVTDTRGFFNLPGHAFPRFFVEMPDTVNPAFDKLFTPDGPSLTAGVGDKLRSILEEIRPCLRGRLPPAVIDVCLSRRDLFFRDAQDHSLPATVRNVNASSHYVNEPGFRICHIHVREPVSIGSDKDMESVIQFVRRVPIRIGHFQLSPRLPGGLNNATPSTRATWLQTFFQLGDTSDQIQGGTTSFSFQRHHVNDAVFQALVSTLPFATSLHSLALGTECMERVRLFEQVDLPWIAYALFHPHAPLSSWQYLDLDRLPLTPQCEYVLTAMARGNNLLALQNGTAPDCEAYFSAKVVDGTLIQQKPSRESQVLCGAPPTGVAVDMCGISSLDRATWGDWVAVIAPAYGLGWVRPDELYKEQAHAPGKPSLTGLRLRRELKRSDAVVNNPPDELLHLLRPLGSALLYLNISIYQDATPQTLSKILHACGSLKALVVGHAGDFWSEGSPHGTRLEELELVVRPPTSCVATPTRDHIVTSLRHLRALRVRVEGRTQVHILQASRLALEQLLAHGAMLGYVHWQQALGRSVPYASRQSNTATVMAQLQLTDAKYLHKQLRLSPACALAFLSVTMHSSDRGESAMGRLRFRDVLTIIFQFATTPVRRSIYIESGSF